MKPNAWCSKIAGLVVVLAVVAACGGGDGGGIPAGGDPDRQEGTGVLGLVVLHREVQSESGDALGAPPDAWNQRAEAVSFDRALSHADWTVVADEPLHGVTGADGSFRIQGLEPGYYFLDFTKTLDGNLVSATVPFSVGPDGDAEVIAEVAWGMVRAMSEYTDGGVEVREVWGPSGNRVRTRDGRIVEIGDSSHALADADGDGRFEDGPCVDRLWRCDSDRECGDLRVCQCTASCPFCDDCGPPVCVPLANQPPYRCDEGGSCAQPGDRCVCVSSCPDCTDCGFNVCVPNCDPAEIVEILVAGPSQLIAGQQGSMSAIASFSGGFAMDVTHLVDWVSSDPATLIVDSWGTVTAAKVGTAEVAAILGEIDSEPWQIEVVERPSLTRIYVHNVSCYYPYGFPVAGDDPTVVPPVPEPKADFLPVPDCLQVVRIGGRIQFAAIGEFGDGLYFEDVTQKVDWQVTPAGVGEVAQGSFTALQEGVAQLAASLEGAVSDPIEIRVVAQPTLVALSIYASEWAYPAIAGIPPGPDGVCWECGFALSVLRGDEVQFRATAQYDTGEWEDVTELVAWRSSDASVAAIDEGGLLYAVGGGQAQVDAVLDGLTSNAVDIRVVNEATLQSISAYPEGGDRVAATGGQLFFRAMGYYDVGLSRDVTEEATWRSSDESVGGFDEPGVFTGRGAGIIEVWAELGGLESQRYTLEVFATGELDYCDPDNINRAVWSDAFNRVVLESDCAEYEQPGVVTVRYTVTETQPHGGVFDPCLDLYVLQGERRIRMLREEGCGEPFLGPDAPEFDEALLKFQLRAFWDLKDEAGEAVPPGTYTIYGRFFLYYDPVVSIDVTVLPPYGTAPSPKPTGSTFSPTPTPTAGVVCTPPQCDDAERLACGQRDGCPGGCGMVCQPSVVCTPPPCAPGEVFYCPADCFNGCGVVCATPTPSATKMPTGLPGEFDLTGLWAVTVPELGLTCPVVVEQAGALLEIEGTCAGIGVTATFTGSIDETGTFSASGSLPPLCFMLSISGRATADGNWLSGSVECDGLLLRFEGVRGSDSIPPTPTPVPTAMPTGVPGEFDLTGLWTVTVPELGFTCPVAVEQVGWRLEIEGTCAEIGMNATLTGSIDETGTFTASGPLPPLCFMLSLSGMATANGDGLRGSADCDGLLLHFEGTRGQEGRFS